MVANRTENFCAVSCIDTQVYINESYNFNKKGNLSYFRKQILDGKVIHLSSEIVVKEVEINAGQIDKLCSLSVL